MKHSFYGFMLVAFLGSFSVRLQAEPLPGLTLPEVLSHMEQAQHSLQTIVFHFTETRGNSATADHIEGDVAFKRPHQLRIEQSHPEKQILWSDGTHLWLYSPAENQELTGAWKLWLSRSGFPAPLLSFISDFQAQSWTTRYQVLFGGYDNHLYQVILKPKSDGDVPMTVWVSDETFFPVRGELPSATTPVSVLFKNVRVNPALDDRLFTPTIPAGTAVVPLPS